MLTNLSWVSGFKACKQKWFDERVTSFKENAIKNHSELGFIPCQHIPLVGKVKLARNEADQYDQDMEFSYQELNSIAKKLIEKAKQNATNDHATLVTLSGDLGAGKTTLIQEVARCLGIEETLQSPTYIIYKKYPVPGSFPWKYLIHGDMYRLDSESELTGLGWEELLNNPENFICIEWPEKVQEAIPDWSITLKIGHKGEKQRTIDL